jgi:hypothetical protein
MNNRRNVKTPLLVVALVIAWSLLLTFGVLRVVRAEHNPQTPAEEWLSWSAEDRTQYVHRYLEGFERGKKTACYWHEEREASSASARMPAGTCINSLPEFTEPYLQVYVDAVTKYFTKYPHDRQAGWSSILDELASPPSLTIEQIHAKLGSNPK